MGCDADSLRLHERVQEAELLREGKQLGSCHARKALVQI